MSLSKRDRKIQSVSGKEILASADAGFTRAIANALHRDFGETHQAVKIVVSRTKANERAVKNWFAAKNGPTGRNLVDLVRISDEVLEAVLIMSDRRELVVAKKLADSRQLLTEMFRLIGELQTQRGSDDPRDVIYAAIYSAYVKYPKKDDPAPSNRWIEPKRSAHLAKVVMQELDANGFQIVKKAG
jgi:hypothetical protein